MIQEILKQLLLKGVDRIVYTDISCEEMVKQLYSGDNIKHITDSRSAAFYAFGESKMMGYPVVLLVNEEEIASCYTAFTEIWFQRIPLIVVAYNSKGWQTTEYLERCVEKISLIDDTKELEQIQKQENLCGVWLLKTKETILVEQPFDYTSIISSVNRTGYDGSIFCFHTEKAENDKIINIETKHKYCVVSKYFGYLNGGKRAILCIPDYLLEYDSNAFEIRDIPSSLFIAIKQTGLTDVYQYKEWMESRGCTVMNSDDLSKLSSSINEKPTVLICK